MNARIEIEPSWEEVSTIEIRKDGGSRTLAVALITRALLLTVPRDIAERELGLHAEDPRWGFCVYQALAAREVDRFAARPIRSRLCGAASARPVDSLVLSIRQVCAARGPLDTELLAALLFQTAFELRLPDLVLVEKILQEVDVAAYAAARR